MTENEDKKHKRLHNYNLLMCCHRYNNNLSYYNWGFIVIVLAIVPISNKN